MGRVIKRSQMAGCLAGHRKVVATNGCFDILHIAHKRLLEHARSLGDVLVVALNNDTSVRGLKGAGRPVVPQEERAEMLAAFGFVDFVVVFGGRTAESIMGCIKPSIYIKGGEYTDADIPERSVVEEHGGKVVFLPMIHDYSTSQMVSDLGSVTERQHVTFALWDKFEAELLKPAQAGEHGVMLSANGMLISHRAGFDWRDGQLNPDPVLLRRDVSPRYRLCAKVAGG